MISLVLEEIQHRCTDWESFCNEFGWSEWCCSEGGGHIMQDLTEEQAIKYGIITEGNL